MIARLEVTRGTLTEYPLAERTKNGWQNGGTFYPDAEVTKVTPLVVRPASLDDHIGDVPDVHEHEAGGIAGLPPTATPASADTEVSRAEDMGPAANCHLCIGAGGHEGHDGEWIECVCQRPKQRSDPSDALDIAQAFALASQTAEGFATTSSEHAERRRRGVGHAWAAGYDAACADISVALWVESEARLRRGEAR